MPGCTLISVSKQSSPKSVSTTILRLIKRVAKRRPNSRSGLITKWAPTALRIRLWTESRARATINGVPNWLSKAVQMIESSLELSPIAQTAASRLPGSSLAISVSSVTLTCIASATKREASSTKAKLRSTAKTSTPFSESVLAKDIPNWPKPIMRIC